MSIFTNSSIRFGSILVACQCLKNKTPNQVNNKNLNNLIDLYIELVPNIINCENLKTAWGNDDLRSFNSGELTKLWNQCPNNLEACKGKERDFLPSLEEYFSDAIQQIENPSKDDENLLKDANFGWRALRLLARRSPHFFTTSNTIMNPLSSYLEMMVRKVAHEKPGKENSQDTQNDNEIDNILTEEEQATEDLKPTECEEFVDDNITRGEHKNITLQQLLLFSEKLAPDWPKLAIKLGYKPDEIEFFKNENPTLVEQARNLLQIWFEDDEDANLDNLLYILEGLELHEAAEVVKHEIANVIDP